MRRDANASAVGSTFEGNGRGVIGFFMSACVAVALLAALAPALASAALTRVPQPFSPITGAGSGLTIEAPGGIAVDETSGNVFLNDGAARTDILGAEGGAPAGLASPFEITGFSFQDPRNGIAVDNSVASPNRGTVYIVSATAPLAVKRFVRDPLTERYVSAGPDWVSTAPGSAGGIAGAAVDIHGNLFVGDFNSQSVVKFSTAGGVESIYDLSESIRRPETIAVDAAGDLFAARSRAGGGGVFKYPADSSGAIDPSNFVEILAGSSGAIAVDPNTNALFVGFENRVVEYDATTLAKKLEFGLGTLENVVRLAVNSAEDWVYASDNGADNENVAAFGAPVSVPTVIATAATDVTGTKASLNGVVNPDGLPVTECFFEWGETEAYGHKTASCEGTIGEDSANYPVSFDISGLVPDGATYHYRLVAKNANGTARSSDKTLVTASTVATEAASGIGATTATLNGALRPEANQYTSCLFEYGLATSSGFESTAPCSPPAEAIEPDFAVHPVSAALTGLQTNATYKFRLTATNPKNGVVRGETLTFSTQGPPHITEVRASFADQTSVTLEAKINPSGFNTSYRFEWGPSVSYGNRVPADVEPFIGGGEEPVRVNAKISGLSAGTTYHYRVVATNSVGVTASGDQTLETLNSCGLPEGRCFEMVSPREIGPVAMPGQPAAAAEVQFQSDRDPGSTLYIVEAGFPSSTKGAEVMYHGTRGPEGWSSSQFSPPITARSETNSIDSSSSVAEGISEDLSCAILASNQPLTDDASTRFVVEAGGSNLFRRNPDGSYTAITKLAPEHIQVPEGPFGEKEMPVLGAEYALAGFSDDCHKVVFSTYLYRYPGIPGAGAARLYEWDEGELRNLGVVPGPSGEVVVAATPGSGENHSNIVSDDGSRVFFSAQRQTSPNPSEVGVRGIFVREDGTVTRDLSLSETSTPAEEATYQYATKDGTRVFFTANAGLTDESSPSGTDLYEYDLESEKLTDLSALDEAGGAQVGGFVGASEDGSHVYFVAEGQLVPGKGKTLSQNQSDQTFSLYGAVNGDISYVGSVQAQDVQSLGLTVTSQASWSSRVSSDGRYLLFEVSRAKSGLGKDVYLYDGEASEPPVCLSCRQDGFPSTTKPLLSMLAPGGTQNELYAPRSLVEVNGEPHVYFRSRERLARGAVEGRATLYEWSHGQVFAIATEPAGLVEESPVAPPPQIYFADASAEGTDIYFSTPERLTWEDSDDRYSMYSARVGGGFPEPPSPAPPCDPQSESSCQAPSNQSPVFPGAGSTGFVGPGNVKPTKKKKHQQKKKKKQKKKGKSKQKKQANGNRRAGK